MPKVKRSNTEKRIVRKLSGGVLPLLGVALALFVVSGAIYLLFDRLISDVGGENLLTGWEYTYSDTPEVEYRSDLMRNYNLQTPIVKSDTHHDYIYFRKTLEASDDPRTLTLITDHSPVRILVNGHERYNDRYSGDGSADYTGNCYNAVVIEPSQREITVEIFMRLPYSVRFEVTLDEGEHASDFVPGSFFITGCIVCGVGLLGALALFALSLRKKTSRRSSAVCLVIAYCGAVMALYVVRDHTYLVNEPIWMNITAAAILFALYLCVFTMTRFVRKNLKIGTATIVSFAASVAMILFSDATWSLQAAMAFSAGAGAACAAAIVYTMYQATMARTQYASAILIFSGYYFFCALVGGLCLYFRKSDAAVFLIVFPTIVVMISLIVIDRILAGLAEEKAKLSIRSRLYGECVDNLSAFIRKVLTFKTVEDFLNGTPGEIAKLAASYEGHEKEKEILDELQNKNKKKNGSAIEAKDKTGTGNKDDNENKNGKKNKHKSNTENEKENETGNGNGNETADGADAGVDEENKVYYCAAKKDDTEYVEYVNEGVEDCQYKIIERNLARDHLDYFFSGTYFEMSFRPSDGSLVLFHFEGLKSCLDRFFTDLMESAYSGCETALDNIVKADGADSVVILERIADAAEMSDGYSASHSDNVEKFTFAVCEKMGLDQKTSHDIALASRLHDIGKFAIPRGIIRKDTRLSDEERAIVAEHSEYGYKLLSAFSDNEELALASQIARCHHEHFDGTGRMGLAGEEIPLAARIVSVCDTFDALTSERPYKKAWSFDDAAVELRRCSGTILDPSVVSTFLGSLTEFIQIKLEG